MQPSGRSGDSDSGEEDYEMVQRSPQPQTQPRAQAQTQTEAYYDPRYGVLIAGSGSPSNSPSTQLYLRLRPRTVGRRKWMLAGPLGFMLLCGGLLASVCFVVPLAMISLSYGEDLLLLLPLDWGLRLWLKTDDGFATAGGRVAEQAR